MMAKPDVIRSDLDNVSEREPAFLEHHLHLDESVPYLLGGVS
jgi:hypothetical protein